MSHNLLIGALSEFSVPVCGEIESFYRKSAREIQNLDFSDKIRPWNT